VQDKKFEQRAWELSKHQLMLTAEIKAVKGKIITAGRQIALNEDELNQISQEIAKLIGQQDKVPSNKDLNVSRKQRPEKAKVVSKVEEPKPQLPQRIRSPFQLQSPPN